VLAIVGSITLLVYLFPKAVFFLNGVSEIPAFGLLCLRLVVTHFIFRGFNSIFRLYFAGRGDSYAVSANGGRDIRNQLMIKFFPDSCIFTIMDDGRCIMLDEDEETKELITNYSMIRKTASSVRYQYILNLNYTVFCFA
ncbi:MAG: hypothetical protein Q4F32_08095, partial [Eubacteriales bacterium]|nr:hypothetical protein [Eubacteriales bacterium]